MRKITQMAYGAFCSNTPLIQSEEQAKGVLGVMKMMNAFDTLFNESKGE